MKDITFMISVFTQEEEEEEHFARYFSSYSHMNRHTSIANTHESQFTR